MRSIPLITFLVCCFLSSFSQNTIDSIKALPFYIPVHEALTGSYAQANYPPVHLTPVKKTFTGDTIRLTLSDKVLFRTMQRVRSLNSNGGTFVPDDYYTLRNTVSKDLKLTDEENGLMSSFQSGKPSVITFAAPDKDYNPKPIVFANRLGTGSDSLLKDFFANGVSLSTVNLMTIAFSADFDKWRQLYDGTLAQKAVAEAFIQERYLQAWSKTSPGNTCSGLVEYLSWLSVVSNASVAKTPSSAAIIKSILLSLQTHIPDYYGSCGFLLPKYFP